MPGIDLPHRYPVLSDWMTGANPEHPLAADFRRPDGSDHGQWMTFDEIEAVLATLVAAAPQRLGGKRRDFRALRPADGALRGLRAELVFAAYLARHGIAFDFGAPGTPQPDLVLRELNLGFEITTRKADVVWQLRQTLASAVREAQPRVHLHLEFSAKPFAIRSKVAEAITDEVLAAIAAGEREVQCVVRPASGGHAAITLKVAITLPHQNPFLPDVTVSDPGTLLSPMMRDAEDALVEAMQEERKRRQSQSMPSALVVDIAHIDGAWLRTTSAWGNRLTQLIQPEHAFVALSIMISSGWTSGFRFILGESPFASPAVINDLRTVEIALGMQQVAAENPIHPEGGRT